MMLEDFDSAGERRGRHLAVFEMREDCGFSRLRVLPEHLRNVLRA